MAVEIRAATYAALRTALAAGTYQAGQMVFCEGRAAAGDGGQGMGQVVAIGSLTDDGGVTLTGGSLAWVRLLNDALDIRWYGAVMDGSTDCAGAIQGAVDALPGEGGAIYVPPGIANCGSTITIDKPGVRFVGDGRQASSVLASLPVDYAGPGVIRSTFTGDLFLLDSVANINGFTIEGVNLRGPSQPSNAVGIAFRNGADDFRRDFLIRNCSLTNFGTAVLAGKTAAYAGSETAFGVLRILDNLITGNDFGVRCVNGRLINGFYFHGNDAGQNGWASGGAVNVAGTNLSIVGNVLEGQYNAVDISAASSRNVTVRDNYFESNNGDHVIRLKDVVGFDVGPNYYSDVQSADYPVLLDRCWQGVCVDPFVAKGGSYNVGQFASTKTGPYAAFSPADAVGGPVLYTPPMLNPKRAPDYVFTTGQGSDQTVRIGGFSKTAKRFNVAVASNGLLALTRSITASAGDIIVAQFAFKRNDTPPGDPYITFLPNTTYGDDYWEGPSNLLSTMEKAGEWVHVLAWTKAAASTTSLQILLWPYGISPGHGSDITYDLILPQVWIESEVSGMWAGLDLSQLVTV